MKNTGLTLLNLRTSIKETLIITEKYAKVSRDLIEVEAFNKILKEIESDIAYSRTKLMDRSIEIIDNQGINMKANEVKDLVKTKVQVWRT